MKGTTTLAFKVSDIFATKSIAHGWRTGVHGTTAI
jgi:hypothetical protein